jgi:hypothetical protein
MTNTIDYSGMIDRAMRGVVKECLELAQKQGLPGQHHFFVSFRTDFPTTKISETLRAKYPEEMTIVLQHQFWDLKIEDDLFSVMLSFNNVPEKLVIPYAALTAFADPSIKFGLQFNTETMAREQQNNPPKPIAEEQSDAQADTEDAEPPEKVISLDRFRKK